MQYPYNKQEYCINSSPGLQELTLSANAGISPNAWTRLFVAVSANSRLRVLNIDYNRIGDYGAGCLAVMLAANKTLETLDLEGTGISDFGGQVMGLVGCVAARMYYW